MQRLARVLAAFLTMSWTASAQELRSRPVEDDVIYFLLPDRFANGEPDNDRGGIHGGRLDHGFDPAHKGFFHGGDLAGLRKRLDYLEALGVTAIWLGPIYRNKPVQGAPGAESAGYHGYWITDFTDVDPHFGTRSDLEALVDAAHARGIRVILDIITNHTADVIAYRECHDTSAGGPAGQGGCPYRDEGSYPYTTRGAATGPSINDGFLGFGVATAENFTRLTRADWAYTPYVPAGQEIVKRPAWLNDPIYYHNRGNFDDPGESFVNGDFFGLDDLMTEHPRVTSGMIDIFGQWIADFGIDGFRVDTARHVRPEFWRVFVPAMLEKAESEAIPNFYIFGEVYDFAPEALARHTWDDRFPAVLDFGFQGAVRDVVSRGAGTRRLARLFEADTLYRGGRAGARRLPTFLGNHDMGRFSMFLRQDNPDAGEDELMARLRLAHVLLMTARGVPTLYAGSEQGFISDGGDQSAREDMFPSRTGVYNDNDLLGTERTTADSNFDTNHPLFVFIRNLIALRKDNPALRQGSQVTRLEEVDGGFFAFSRLGEDGTEVLVAINASDEDRTEDILVEPASRQWTALYGTCRSRSTSQASYRVRVPALGAVVCRSQP